MILYMYIHVASGQGWQPLGDEIFMSAGTSCHFGHLLQVVKKNLFEVWFYAIFFMILYVYIAPGQGQTATRGQSFNANKNVLSFHLFDASFKKIPLKSDFIHLFYDLIHVYSHGAGADSPQGTKFGCQQKGIITLPICCKFQRNLFEVWFYTFFSWFNTCI